MGCLCGGNKRWVEINFWRRDFLNRVNVIQSVCDGCNSGQLRLYGEQHRSAEFRVSAASFVKIIKLPVEKYIKEYNLL